MIESYLNYFDLGLINSISVIPLFFVFLILFIKKVLTILENIKLNIASDVADINLFVLYLISTLLCFFIWLLFDTSKNRNNISIHNFYK